MRRAKGRASPGRHSRRAAFLLLAALVFFLFAGVPGCMARQLPYSARGTMIFLPGGY